MDELGNSLLLNKYSELLMNSRTHGIKAGFAAGIGIATLFLVTEGGVQYFYAPLTLGIIATGEFAMSRSSLRRARRKLEKYNELQSEAYRGTSHS